MYLPLSYYMVQVFNLRNLHKQRDGGVQGSECNDDKVMNAGASRSSDFKGYQRPSRNTETISTHIVEETK